MFNQIQSKINATSIEANFKLFIKGDEQGVSYIYNNLFRQLFNYSYGIIKNEFDSNSIVHNAFHKAWIYREKMSNVLHLQRYLFLSVKWGCYKYLDSNYYKKIASHLPIYLLLSEQVANNLDGYEMKDESKERLTLVEMALPYLKINRRMVMKLMMSGLSHHQINKGVSSKYKTLTDDLCYRMKALKNIKKRIKKIQDARKENFSLFAVSIQNYLSPLQCKIFHDYYEKKYSLNKIAEGLNIPPLKALQHHFHIICSIEKIKKKLMKS